MDGARHSAPEPSDPQDPEDPGNPRARGSSGPLTPRVLKAVRIPSVTRHSPEAKSAKRSLQPLHLNPSAQHSTHTRGFGSSAPDSLAPSAPRPSPPAEYHSPAAPQHLRSSAPRVQISAEFYMQANKHEHTEMISVSSTSRPSSITMSQTSGASSEPEEPPEFYQQHDPSAPQPQLRVLALNEALQRLQGAGFSKSRSG